MTQPRPQTVGWLLLPLLATVDGVGAVAAHAARDAGADAASTGLDVAAVETAALFPREYYLAPGLPAQKLQARQAGCQPGTHPCHDIGPAGEGICCPNDMYCVINPSNFTAACCAIGSHCGSPCSASLYQCLTTSTITLSSTRTVNIQTRAAALHPRQEPLTTTTVLSACCPRRCPSTSQFLCATTAGAGCCGYGATCTTSAGTGLCVPTDDPSTVATNSIDPTLIAPPGCETGQISCAASLGGGCCAATQVCTLVSGGVYCAETAPAAADVVDEDGGGLATGAIAGIAVGAVVGVAVLLGVVVWWLRRRRRRRRRGVVEDKVIGEANGVNGSTGRRRGTAGLVGRIIGGSGGSAGMTPARYDLSDGAGSERLPGLPQDYHGPEPAVGPYTEPVTPGGIRDIMLPTGGRPLQPHGPGDIAAPVELDSTERAPDVGLGVSAPPPSLASSPGPQMAMPHMGGRPLGQGHEGYEIYELYGSEVPQNQGTTTR